LTNTSAQPFYPKNNSAVESNEFRRKPLSEKVVKEEELKDEGTYGIAENNL